MSDSLIPPDLERCQAEKSNGVNFMTLGGRRRMERCTARPVVAAVELQPGADGRRGSMSLCPECRDAFLAQYGSEFASFLPAHPKFHSLTTRSSPNDIVLFRFGEVLYPPQEVKDATRRVQIQLAQIPKEDLQLAESWGARLTWRTHDVKVRNPEITPEMMESCKQASLAAYPGREILDSWVHSLHGLVGVSVWLSPEGVSNAAAPRD